MYIYKYFPIYTTVKIQFLKCILPHLKSVQKKMLKAALYDFERKSNISSEPLK